MPTRCRVGTGQATHCRVGTGQATSRRAGTGRAVGEKAWWTVRTDCGTRRTLAASRAKAIRNVKYRIVMDRRGYGRPTPRDLAEMRDIEVVDARRDQE